MKCATDNKLSKTLDCGFKCNSCTFMIPNKEKDINDLNAEQKEKSAIYNRRINP